MTDIFAYISFFYYLCTIKIDKGIGKTIEYILQNILKKYVNYYLRLLIII